jgi:transcriptional regulator with XRE-family HTH domain
LQKEFAASVGLPGSTYNQIESGKQILTPAQAARIYQRYGISLNWIYLGIVWELPIKLVEVIKAERLKSPERSDVPGSGI